MISYCRWCPVALRWVPPFICLKPCNKMTESHPYNTDYWVLFSTCRPVHRATLSVHWAMLTSQLYQSSHRLEIPLHHHTATKSNYNNYYVSPLSRYYVAIPWTFEISGWKLAHWLDPPWRTSTPILFFLQLLVFEFLACITRRTDGWVNKTHCTAYYNGSTKRGSFKKFVVWHS